jgi:uncharacterized protein (TIGR02145 family)
MAYNLGADVAKLKQLYPELTPAKQQMKYLALQTYTNESTDIPLDSTVFGNFYQWGRVADGHEKRNAAAFTSTGALTTGLNSTTGQVLDDTDGSYDPASRTQKYGHFIGGKNETVDDNDYNWRSKKDDLWGNGYGIDHNFGSDASGGGVYYNHPSENTKDGYYQNTTWAIGSNNPCPSGWRIPTQDEWKRLGNYGCPSYDPSVFASGGVSYSSGATATTTRDPADPSGTDNELYWVPVASGKVSFYWADNTVGELGGLALYTSSVWTNADLKYTGGTDFLYEEDAPEPLLFLPAAGIREYNRDSFSKSGSFGYYWSSTVYLTNAISMYFAGYGNGNSVSPSASAYRTNGCSVRCVKSEL